MRLINLESQYYCVCKGTASPNVSVHNFWGIYYFPLIVCLFLIFYVLQAAHHGVEIAFEYQ